MSSSTYMSASKIVIMLSCYVSAECSLECCPAALWSRSSMHALPLHTSSLGCCIQPSHRIVFIKQSDECTCSKKMMTDYNWNLSSLVRILDGRSETILPMVMLLMFFIAKQCCNPEFPKCFTLSLNDSHASKHHLKHKLQTYCTPLFSFK